MMATYSGDHVDWFVYCRRMCCYSVALSFYTLGTCIAHTRVYIYYKHINKCTYLGLLDARGGVKNWIDGNDIRLCNSFQVQ